MKSLTKNPVTIKSTNQTLYALLHSLPPINPKHQPHPRQIRPRNQTTLLHTEHPPMPFLHPLLRIRYHFHHGTTHGYTARTSPQNMSHGDIPPEMPSYTEVERSVCGEDVEGGGDSADKEIDERCGSGTGGMEMEEGEEGGLEENGGDYGKEDCIVVISSSICCCRVCVGIVNVNLVRVEMIMGKE
mmetsp:Transcript_3561/g.7632  ORF Transcript_3561/g.7632 Transcript_3561/m.7632 type:complete len:186 (+) Transcript_3561:180-737(+)